MTSDVVLLTIRPEHAAQMYSGQKRAELRKSFPATARIVFLYETAPVAAVTGAFTVRRATKASVSQAVELAAVHGVDPNRAETYYGERENGWVVEVGLCVRVPEAIHLAELRRRDHYFSVPQTYAYLDRFEALTQYLMDCFVSASSSQVFLRPISESTRGAFEQLMLSDVGSDYEDIDDDFVSQVLDRGIGLRAAFSTTAKHVLEAHWGPHVIGFTVLTQKSFGSWKTGPTILLAEFRGLGLGQVLRRAVKAYCLAHGALGIYCTAAETKPAVVAYLLNSGMRFQARLRQHLAAGRDELVFSEHFREPRSVLPAQTRKTIAPGTKVMRISSDSEYLSGAVDFFLKLMPYWYFRPHEGLKAAVVESVLALDQGTRRYSDKGRALFALRGPKASPVAAALVTMKRSGMAKINLVSSLDTVKDQRRLLAKVVEEFDVLRRLYLTIPMTRVAAIMAAASLGFAFEGVLHNPFGTGLDHACLGLVRGHKRSKTKLAR